MAETSTTDSPSPAGALPALSRPFFVLGGALIVGFLMEWLIHVRGLGFGYALATLVAVAGWLLIGWRLKLRASRPALLLLLYIAVLGALTALRASPTLQIINALTCLALILLTAVIYRPGRLHQLSLTHYVTEGFLSAVSAIGQPFVLLFSDLPAAHRQTPAGRRGIGPALGGILLALPLLLLFGGLFYAADAVFAAYIDAIFRNITLADILAHLFLGLWLSWLAAGVLRHAFTRRPDNPASITLKMGRPAGLGLGSAQALIVLVSLNALFLAFVLIQAVYLFGGAATIQSAGMSYSEYARRGFFELVAVAALVLTIVLALDWLTWPRTGAAGKAVNLLHALLIAFTFVIMASALQRMWLYQRAFGLTELRFYTTAFMAWLALVLLWLVMTVLSRLKAERAAAGRRLFACGALVAALALILTLNILNPDALIARTNMARAIAGVGEPLDVNYLTEKLSADATPALVAALPALRDSCAPMLLARNLQSKQEKLSAQIAKQDWRSLTYSKLRAAALLTRNLDMLKQRTGYCQ